MKKAKLLTLPGVRIIAVLAIVLVILGIIIMNNNSKNSQQSTTNKTQTQNTESKTPTSVQPTNPTAPTPQPTQTVVNFKIVALGDSLTSGTGSTVGGFPYYIKQDLAKSNIKTDFLNLGKSAWNSSNLINGKDGIKSQLTQAASSQAKVALVLIGINDLWELYGTKNPTEADEVNDLNRFKNNIDRILSTLSSKDMKVFIGLLYDQTKTPRISNDSTRQAYYPGLSEDELPRLTEQTSKYNDVIRQKANQYNSYIVDFSSTDIFSNPATISDGFHPNDAGYKKMAEIWMQELNLVIGI